jgi:hypothetical protein
MGACVSSPVDLLGGAIREWHLMEPRMRRACRRLVRRHRRANELVAEALTECGELTGREIDALVRAQ